MALTKSEKSLFNAVKAGNLKQVKTLLKKVTDVDFEGDYGRTPLEQAIIGGKLTIVQELLEAGANKNRVNDYEQTPLDTARAYGKTQIAKYLKDEGAYKASEANKYSSGRSFGSRFDDDDYFTSRTFDDDDDWGTPKKAVKKSAAKKSANRSFGAQSVDDETGGEKGGSTARAEKANQPVKPKFTEESLKDIFNAKNWVGKTEEMKQLWEEVPIKLQKKYDFDAALAEAKRETLKRNAPQAASLKLNAQPPQQDEGGKMKPPSPSPQPPANG